MKTRRKEFVSEIKHLKLVLAEVSRRLSELEELANPTCAIGASVTIVPDDDPFHGDENHFAAKVAFGMSMIRMNR